MEIRKYMELNDTENVSYQNLQDTAKTLLRKKIYRLQYSY